MNSDYQFLKKGEYIPEHFMILILGATCLLLMILIYIFLDRHKRERALPHQLSLQNRKLIDANRQKSELIRTLAHDVRNPASAIYSLISLLSKKEGQDEESEEFIHMINISSMRIVHIVENILSTESFEQSGKLINVGDFLGKCINLLKYQAHQKSQEIALKHGPEATITVNPCGLERAINNLIVNALKFSEAHQQIDLSWVVENNEVIIIIRDYGVGIPEHIRPFIFGSSETVKRKGTAGETSFELGLKITQNIILENGGRIWFETKEYAGTTFFVALPLQLT